MKLSIVDRLTLLHILPKEGDVVTLRVQRDLSQRLSFTEAEHASLQFVSTPEKTEWKQDTIGEVEILIGPKAQSLIVGAFEALNSKKLMKLEFLPTYEKFMEEEKKEKEEGA